MLRRWRVAELTDARSGFRSPRAGKVVEADYGTSHATVFVGSENFSSTSLNQNRELGLVTSSHPVMAAIANTFAADFGNGKSYS